MGIKSKNSLYIQFCQYSKNIICYVIDLNRETVFNCLKSLLKAKEKVNSNKGLDTFGKYVMLLLLIFVLRVYDFEF